MAGRVTVLNGETLHEIKICHGNKIEKVDIAVVHCSSNHYLPLGKCTVIVVFCTVIHNIHTAIDVVSAAIFVHVVRFLINQSSAVIVAVATVMHYSCTAIDDNSTAIVNHTVFLMF